MSAIELNLSLDAGRQVLRLKWADKKLEEIVSWADEKILYLDEIPDALFQLSMADTLEKCRDCLNELSKGADKWEVLKLFLNQRDKELSFESASLLSIQLFREYLGNDDCPEGLLRLLEYESSFFFIGALEVEGRAIISEEEEQNFLALFCEDLRRFSDEVNIPTEERDLWKALEFSVMNYLKKP